MRLNIILIIITLCSIGLWQHSLNNPAAKFETSENSFVYSIKEAK